MTDRSLHRIQVFDSVGNYQFQFGTEGTGNGQFQGPFDAAISNSGNIHVADHDNQRVQVFDSAGNYQFQFGNLNNTPRAIGVDDAGNTYVDNGSTGIHVFDSVGTFQFQFGSAGTGNGQFDRPHGIAIDSGGNIYVADSRNHRVQVFDSAGNYQFQFGSEGTGNGQFNMTHGIAIDSGGSVYVTDFNNGRVQVFDSAGNYQFQFGSMGIGNGRFRSPDGIAIDNAGRIYVADSGNRRVQVFQLISDSTIVTANSFLVTEGDYVSGGLPELEVSDNMDLTLRRRNSDLQSRTEFEVKSTSTTATPTSFEFTLEGSVFARGNVVQTIELFDYDAGAWELVDTTNANRAPMPDSVVTATPTGDLSRFVETGTMCVQARIHFQSDSPRQRFASNTDQAVWTIGQ